MAADGPDVARSLWEEAFFKNLRQLPVPNEAFLRLQQACGRSNLLRYLYFYTDPFTHGFQKQERAATCRTREALNRTLKALAEVDKEVRRLIPWLHSEVLRNEIGEARQYDFIKALDTYTERLRTVQREYARRSSLKGQLRDEEYLVLLSLRVKHKTGRPHWGDLAYVLVAAYTAHGEKSKELDQFTVREIVRRYQKSYPEKAAMYLKRVQAGAFFFGADEDQPASPGGVRRVSRKK